LLGRHCRNFSRLESEDANDTDKRRAENTERIIDIETFIFMQRFRARRCYTSNSWLYL
jgi:hypothetical protein